jgi:prepilin-type N-terminal cleavage/methylation domain-containing protein
MSIKNQRGFTLVEIAIVLVIIGLLLGGILKGQQLITSARVRNLADQNAGIQAAYYGFLDRFRSFPGDMTPANACASIGNAVPTCPGTGVGGDGDQSIENFGEAAAAWSHLAAAGFITGDFRIGTATNATDYTAVTVAPVNAFTGRLGLIRSQDYVGVGVGPRLNLALGQSIPASVARELDVKIDDGVAGTGVLRGAVDTATTLAGVADNGAAAPACITGTGAAAVWNVAGDSQNCNAAFLY